MKDEKNNKETKKVSTSKPNVLIMWWLFLCFFMPVAGFGFSLNDSSDIDLTVQDSASYGAFVDSNVLELKNRVIIFIEYENAMVIDRIDLRTGEKKRVLDFNENDWDKEKDTTKLRGHWSGIEFGLNNFVTADEFTFKRSEENDYMSLAPFRSWNMNINFAQSTTPIIKGKLALVSGLGIEFNHYFFDNENSLRENGTGDIESRPLTEYEPIRKSKLNVTYITAPLLLEFQAGKGGSKDKFYLSGGVVLGYKIASAIKVIHGEKGERQKLVERGGDVNLNPWQLALTARTGYKDYFNFFASYGLSQFFIQDAGPELFPFSFGLRIDIGE